MIDLSILTDSERAHLTDNGMTKPEYIEQTFRYQKEDRETFHIEPCPICREIAIKLGFEV